MKLRTLVALSSALLALTCQTPSDPPDDVGGNDADVASDASDAGDADGGSAFGPSVIPPYAASRLNRADFAPELTGDSFEWLVAEEPEHRAALILESETENPTIVPRVPGRYVLILEVTDGGTTETKEISIRARAHECPGATEIDSSPDGDTTWENVVEEPGCADFRVTSDVYLSTQRLTIDPGVVVVFEDAGLTVATDAELHAQGTGREPVALVGEFRESGSWPGVRLESVDGGILEHTIILNGGGGNGDRAANLQLQNLTGLELQNLYIARSANFGVHVSGTDTDVASFADSIITGNETAPVRAPAHLAHLLESSNSFVQNADDWISLRPGPIEATVRWQKLDVPYRVTAPVTDPGAIELRGDLTIDPGSTVTFEQRMGMSVTGNLNATGTEQEMITFTGTEETPGHWRGIAVLDGSGTFEWTVVEYGGSDRYPIVEDRANVLLIQNGPPAEATIRNSIIRHGGGHGLYQRRDTALTFEDNVVTENAASPVIVPIDGVHVLGPDSDFQGNGEDVIHVDPAAFDGGEWEDLGVDYVVRNATDPMAFCIEGALVLQPGVTIRFQDDQGMKVCPGGSLQAEGTEMEPIEFLAYAGQWRGILIQEGSAQFDHIVVDQVGSTAYVPDHSAAVTLLETSADPGVTANASFGDKTEGGSGAMHGIAFGGVNTFAPGSPGCAGMGSIWRADPDLSPQCN